MKHVSFLSLIKNWQNCNDSKSSKFIPTSFHSSVTSSQEIENRYTYIVDEFDLIFHANTLKRFPNQSNELANLVHFISLHSHNGETTVNLITINEADQVKFCTSKRSVNWHLRQVFSVKATEECRRALRSISTILQSAWFNRYFTARDLICKLVVYVTSCN